MLGILEHARVKLAVAFAWKFGDRKASAIRGFQATEADGVWHLHRALERIDDPKVRAILFTHSLEEESHAEEFAHAYKLYTERSIPPATYERQDLLASGAPTWKALAFVHVGEEDATERFGYIAQALGDEPLKHSLDRICADEAGHVDLTENLLRSLGAQPDEMKREYAKVRIARLWEGWMRSGRRVVDVIVSGLLSVAYFLLAPWVCASAQRALRARTVAYDNNHLKRMTA